MAHNAKCSNATKPRCRCSCGGVLHGGGAQRLGDGPWGGSVAYEHNHRETYLGDTLDGPTVRLLDGLFVSPTVDLVDTTSDLIADEIARALGRRGVEFRKDLRQSHTICSFTVVLVEAMTTLLEAAPTAAREMAERVIEEIVRRRPGGVVGRLNAKTAGKVAKVLVGKFQDTTTLGSLRLYITVCRCVAVASCPDPEDHPEVRERCIDPLRKEIVAKVTAEVQRLLTELIERWYEDVYRGGQQRNVVAGPPPGIGRPRRGAAGAGDAPVRPPERAYTAPPPRRGDAPVEPPERSSGRQKGKRFRRLTALKHRWPFGRG
jgi:hypothetical protein